MGLPRVTRVGLAVAIAVAAGGQLAIGSPAPTRFDPHSVTFVSLERGWVLGTASCASGTCLELRETADAGRSWAARPLPAGLVAAAKRRPGAAALNVRFADPSDGWIYGALAGHGQGSVRATLWSTHDGGLRWRSQPLRGLGSQDAIFDVEAARGTAYLMESNAHEGVTVKRSPVGEDRWREANTVTLGDPAGGAEQSGAFVLAGSSGWLVEGNDRGTTGSARLSGGRWVAWTPPCAAVGHSFAIPAASTASDLVAVCVMGGFAYPLSAAAPRGATLGSSWLYSSSDGGRSFSAGAEIRRRDVGDPAAVGGPIASPRPGVVVRGDVSATGTQDVVATFDGGARWAEVYRGQPLFLGFTSPTQGVGIVQTSVAATTMIMTFDGGQHWAPVSF